MIKLITVDMDGTFLNDDKEMSPEFDKVFKALKEKGVKNVSITRITNDTYNFHYDFCNCNGFLCCCF